MRSSYGTGYTDAHFDHYRQGALAAGIDVIIYYHYAYPQFNAAEAEADYQHQVVGVIRPQDVLMLDYEEGASQANASWALAFLSRQEQNYEGRLPTIYASDAYIRARLQDGRFARYPLTLANWQFSPSEHPECPPPWKSYTYLQYTDRATNIPGIAGTVDANIYLGGGDELPKVISLNEVSHWYKAISEHQWQSLIADERGHYNVVQYAILDFYRSYGSAGLCGLTFLGLPQSMEIPIERFGPAFAHLAGKGIVVQFFERGVICYDPAHLIDTPPGSGAVYLLHLYNGGPGTDPLIAVLEAQITALKKQQGGLPPTLQSDMQQVGSAGKYLVDLSARYLTPQKGN